MSSHSLVHLVLALLLLKCTCVLTQLVEACNVTGEVRLNDGSINSHKGRLEICARGEWGTVCSDHFNINAARVVCRQLGVEENDLSMVVTNIFFGGGETNQPIHLDEVRCTGTETSLLNCTHSDIGAHDCIHLDDVGIICRPSQDCTDGDVRLVDGDNYTVTAGRVEYCVGGLWGTVCNYTWGDVDAAVVCRQLNLNLIDPKTLQNVPQVLNRRTPIVLDGVNCRPTDVRLSNCGHTDAVTRCRHEHDAGAFCTNMIVCNDSEVRLIQGNGEMENEGRVDFCRSGRWGVVCYDEWDNNDAEVVCRQLGYDVESGNAVATDERTNLGRDPPPTVLNNVDCAGTETNIAQCPESSQCLFPGAGVICPVQNVSDCTDRDVRLQGTKLSIEIGRVEVCMSGQWGLVCDDDWDDIDASVVCRQLGYTGGLATHMSTFGGSNSNFFFDDVNCTGNEPNIFDCQHPPSTDCRTGSEEAGVICGVTPGILERCTEQHTNKTVSVVGINVTNITVGRIGTCQHYQNQSSLCNRFYKSHEYIFTNTTQSLLSTELDKLVYVLRGGGECGDLVSKVLCHYFFAPCGANDSLHLPLSICPEECDYVETTCANQWRAVNGLLDGAELSTVNCKATGALLQGLTPCCIDAQIEIKDATTDSTAKPDNSLKLVIGLLTALLAALIVGVVVIICVSGMMVKKRKTTIRNLQMEVLSSPPTSLEPRSVSFRKNHDNIDFGDEVKLRNIGSRKLQQAIPNPYSNKQELGLEAPLLAPSDNKMMNRISSSIIRELSSNMLIPYTRLKLMECVGQGEFGVVYKAQYTEPEGDIGYKASMVAVKTLKGFFDDSLVNKIMEESIKMKHFDHPNVLHLIGVCLDAGPAPYVVMPYMANGSLLHYLKKERNNLVLQVGGDEDVKIDVRKRLTVMCLEIASGMDYLAGEKFVHRDLAARNCMIDIHFVIKIADFGLSEDIYAKNYFRQSASDKTVKLPVKWMAPESLSDGVFSEKTDVWSFGVTCWEIFSGGKTPYPGVDPLLLSQMLETEQRLNKPLNAACPDEMYALMMSCWTKQPDDRPNFSEIVKKISNYTEVIAGYLDINFNPFETKYKQIDTRAATEPTTPETPDNERKVLVNADVLAKRLLSEKKKISSPSASPCASPKSSPLLNGRKSSEEQLLSLTSGIEIRIDSPSEEGSIANSDLKV